MKLNRTLAPELHDAVSFAYNLPPLRTVLLDNGIPLYWLNAGVQEVAELNFVLPAGLWHEEKQSVCNAAAVLLKNGTATQTAKQINEALEFYGAALKVNAGNDWLNITLDALVKHLPALLPIVFDIITSAVFPEDELALYRENAVQRLTVSLRECDFVANRMIDAALFGAHHPYGRFSTKESIEDISRADLTAFHKKHMGLEGLRIFMSGSLGENEVRLVNQIFGSQSLSANGSDHSNYTASPSAETVIKASSEGEGVQAAVRVGRRFLTRNHPDFAGMVVLNTLLGGYFGSRLMSNIREEKGYTYGIYSAMSAFAHDGSLIIQSEVGTHVAEAAIKEIYAEMDLLCSEKADEEELLLVKNYLLGTILGDLDGPFSIMQRWRSLILNGFGAEKFAENINTYKHITSEELMLLAQKYLNKKDFTELTVI